MLFTFKGNKEFFGTDYSKGGANGIFRPSIVIGAVFYLTRNCTFAFPTTPKER